MRQLYTNQAPIEGVIEVTSTSRLTATTNDIELRAPTDQTRIAFQPTLVENNNEPNNCVSGKIVYERKGKHDTLFPSARGESFISKQNIRMEDALEIALSTSETREFYLGLQKLYQMHEDVGGIPNGTASYVPIDNTVRALQELLKTDASAVRMIGYENTFNLVRELLKLITQGTSHETLSEVLSEIENANLQRFSVSLNLEMLKRVVSEIEKNIYNNKEEFWQSEILEDNPWIISQLFSTPCVYFNSKAYVGGKGIENHGGNVVDFLYRNKMTNNIALIEIKTPCTKLLGKYYRNHSYSISAELSGAVNQVLSYRQSLTEEAATLRANSTETFEVFSPQCIILIGNTREFNGNTGRKDRDQISSFENYRSSLNGVSVITFDELLQKIGGLVSLLSTGDAAAEEDKIFPTAISQPVEDDYDSYDIPF